MTLPLSDAGLPRPGRGLDAWICEHILGLNVVHPAWPCGHVPDGCELEAAGFFTKDKKPCYPEWFPELHPVYLPEHGTWPLESYDGLPGRKEEFYCHVRPCPFVSTTHAYHRVMQAMHGLQPVPPHPNYNWDIRCRSSHTEVELKDIAHGEVWTATAWEHDEPDVERRTAHAVCAVTWKAWPETRKEA